jgi:hypothetical protein
VKTPRILYGNIIKRPISAFVLFTSSKNQSMEKIVITTIQTFGWWYSFDGFRSFAQVLSPVLRPIKIKYLNHSIFFKDRDNNERLENKMESFVDVRGSMQIPIILPLKCSGHCIYQAEENGNIPMKIEKKTSCIQSGPFMKTNVQTTTRPVKNRAWNFERGKPDLPVNDGRQIFL